MSGVLSRLRAVALRMWRSEPVRTVLAPLILAVVAASLIKAGVDGSVAGVVAAVVLGALGFTAQEVARAKVTPTVKLPVVPTARVAAVVERAAESLELAPEHKRVIDALVAQVKYNLPGL